MNCEQVQAHLDDLLNRSDTPPDEGFNEHLAACPRCAEDCDAAREALAALRPAQLMNDTSGLKERIMNGIYAIEANERAYEREVKRWSGVRIRKSAWTIGVAAAIACAMFFSWRNWGNDPTTLSGFALLNQAQAAENALFTGKGAVHIINEIVVPPVANAALAQGRWFPIVAVAADGKPRFNQLTLSVKAGERAIVSDQAWYDPVDKRFARVLIADGKAIFANAYDGRSVYTLEKRADGSSSLVAKPVVAGFKAPASPAEFLGIAAGLPSGLDEKDKSLVSDAGETTLRDGVKARVVKVAFDKDTPEFASDSYFLFAIRNDDHTIAQMEWMAGGESMLQVRRVSIEVVQAPGVAWNLAGIPVASDAPATSATVAIQPGMIVPDVNVKHMIEKADYETYIFSTAPAWAPERQITDVLDLPSPPHRMFVITYRASDKRHVVLVQAHSFNEMLGEKIKAGGKVVYESPKGFKVYSGPRDKWLAGILLQSARAAIQDAPAENRTGYALETPAGTFPCLAVNGPLTEAELHALIDSLVPAKELAVK